MQGSVGGSRHRRGAGATAQRGRRGASCCATLPDGLQRETVFVHDLVLPPDFVPANQDGEAVEHRLVDLDGRGTH